jgi:FixJ family two-component response regulator
MGNPQKYARSLTPCPSSDKKKDIYRRVNSMDDRERLKIVIMQMVEHNGAHLEKYGKWAHFAKVNQLVEAGVLLDEVGKLTAHVGITLRQCLNHLSLTEPAEDIEKGM